MAQCVALGAAADYVRNALENENASEHLQACSNAFVGALRAAAFRYEITACDAQRLPNTISIRFLKSAGSSNAYVDARALLEQTPRVFASIGAACHNRSVQPSATLKAMGCSDEQAAATLRISFGHTSTVQQATEAAQELRKTLEKMLIKK